MDVMNDTTSSTTRTPPPAEPDRGGPPLIRTVDDRVVAGVSGGIGRHFGVDPVIFRVVFAVLALFGGLGVLLYGLGWLLMPADDRPAPLAREVLHGRSVGRAIPAIALTAVGTGVFFSYVDNGFDGAFPLLVVAAIILYVCRNTARVNTERLAAASAKAGDLGAPAPADAAPPPPATSPPAPPGAEPAADGTPLAPGPPKWWRAPAGKNRPPAEPAPRRPRSYLTPATLSLAAVAGGIMWWLSTTSVDVSVQVALAVILAVLAGGLLVGAYFGRGRLLVLPALAVAAVLSAVAAITVPFDGPSGEKTVSPDTVASVQSPYRMKFGELRLDLNELDFAGRAPTDPVRIEATVGAGNLTVYIPDDVRVIVDADADLGKIDLREDDDSSSGWKPDEHTVIEPLGDTPLRGTVVLDLGVGVGNVGVRHGSP